MDESRPTPYTDRTYLEIVQVQDLRKWGPGFHPLQPCFLFFRDLYLNFSNSRLIHWTKAFVGLMHQVERLLEAVEYTHCFSFGRFAVIASGGCIGSYSALPHRPRGESDADTRHGTTLTLRPSLRVLG
jgi:hypothetical protein